MPYLGYLLIRFIHCDKQAVHYYSRLNVFRYCHCYRQIDPSTVETVSNLIIAPWFRSKGEESLTQIIYSISCKS